MRDLDKVCCVIPAAGFGSLSTSEPKRSKLLESIINGQDRPMIVECVRRVFNMGIRNIVVGVNTLFGPEIEKTLKRHDLGGVVRFVYLHFRLGQAELLSQALNVIDRKSCSAILVIYPDMPLWRKKTIQNLIAAHQTGATAITMTSLAVNAISPKELELYGRVLRDKDDKIIACVEPGDVTEEMVAATVRVNPTLFMFDRQWLFDRLRLVPYRPGRDGFSGEFQLPPLALIAQEHCAGVEQVALQDPQETLGVNTISDLQMVRDILRDRDDE